jgi:parallel beta-helix repeat protein
VAINSNIGIAIGISSGNSVSYSNITNCNHGIRLQQSNDNEIANNTISSNGWRCIYLEHSHGNQLYLNNLSGGFYSIYNTYSDSNVIHNNTCQMNGREGLYLWYSDNLTISGNSFEGTPTYPTVLFDGVESLTFNYNVLTGNGVKVYAQVTDVEAIGNTMNGRPLVFLTGVDGITFSGDAGQIILLE